MPGLLGSHRVAAFERRRLQRPSDLNDSSWAFFPSFSPGGFLWALPASFSFVVSFYEYLDGLIHPPLFLFFLFSGRHSAAASNLILPCPSPFQLTSFLRPSRGIVGDFPVPLKTVATQFTHV